MNWRIHQGQRLHHPTARDIRAAGWGWGSHPSSLGRSPRPAATRRHLPARSVPVSRSRARRAPNAPPRSARDPGAGLACTPQRAALSTTAMRSRPLGSAPNARPWLHRTPKASGKLASYLVGGASRGRGSKGPGLPDHCSACAAHFCPDGSWTQVHALHI